MQSLSDQLGAAPVGVNKDADAAAAGQQALQGDAAPSDNALQSSSSQVQTDLLQEELVVPAQNEDVGGQQEEAAEPVPNAPFVADLGIPAQAQGPTPRHTLAAVFAADTSGSSGPSDAGNGVSAAAAVAKRETKKRRASITYITKRRREKLRQAKRGWSGVVQVYHVQDGCRGDKKGKGGRPSHSCRRCEKERKKCSLKDAGEGSYKPCDHCASGDHPCSVEHTDAVTGERFFRVRLGHTYRDEYEGEDGRVYKRTTPATDTEEGLALEEELDEQGQVTRAWHVIDWPPQGMEVETEAEQAQEAEAEADEIGTWFA